MFLLETWQELVLAVVGLLTYFVYRLSLKYRYFSDHGIPCVKYTLLFGSNFDVFRQKKTFGMANDMIYKQLKGNRWGGFYQLLKPRIMVLDPAMIRNIMIKDFTHFHDHFKLAIDEKTNPMQANLFNLSGDRWRALRHKLVPIFTSGKLRWLFDGAMGNCGKELGDLLDTLPRNEDIQVRSIFARYSTDIIASCAFGIDGGALKDPESEFRQMAKKVSNPHDFFKQFLKTVFAGIFPSIFKFFKMKLQNAKVEDFFLSITKQGLNHRRKTGEKRPDFLQLLLELKEKGSVDIDKTENTVDPENIVKLEITDELLAAQTFIFFVAGFENTALTVSTACYFMAKHPDIQEAVQQEIKEAKEKSNGNITYDALNEMKLLEACVKETLRLFTPAELLFRVCTKTYETSEGVINKDDIVIIPVYSLHHDPDYFPEPEKFNPQRFLSPDVDSIVPGTYLPFGDGPRLCIAQRFALLQMKLAVCKVLEKFTLLPSPKNQEPLRLSPKLMNDVVGGVWLRLKEKEW